MDNKLTIRVNIVDRYYPLKIERKDEEKIRKAAKRINDTVLQYKKMYSDEDSQDFLAMAALQFVTKVINNEEENNLQPFIDQIQEIDTELTAFLGKE